MATRFYLQNAAAGYTPPTVKGTWDVSNTSVVRKLAKAKSGSITSAAVSWSNLDMGVWAMAMRVVSDPLPYAKAIQGLFKMGWGVMASAADQLVPMIHVYVTTGDSDTVRGTIFNMFYWIDNYWATTALGREWPHLMAGWENGWDIDSQGTVVNVQPGDRIVIEIGCYNPGGALTTGTATVYYGGTSGTDITQSASATSYPGWFEFSEDPFSPEPTRLTVTDTGAGADSLLLSANLGLSEAGSGAEALTMGAAIGLADAGAGLDTSLLKVALMILLSDSGSGVDTEAVKAALHKAITDSGSGLDAAALKVAWQLLLADGFQAEMPVVGLGAVYDPSIDTGHGDEAGSVSASLAPVLDAGTGVDILSLLASIGLAELGMGVEQLNALTIHVYVRTDGRVDPLGVILLQGGREDILPQARESTEVIPGRPGEVVFSADLGPRGLELRAAAPGNLTPAEKTALKRYVAEWLRPALGAFNIAWEDDTDRFLQVRTAGAIQAQEFADYLEFSVPLKASQPLYLGSTLNTFSGTGTLVSEGNVEAPVEITITGPVTNPSASIGGVTVAWTGTVGADDQLLIDTELMTVKFNGVNALGSFTGAFPRVQPGPNTVTAPAQGSMTITWRDRWV